MDRDDLKSMLLSAGVSLWTLIETAIGVAAAEHGPELMARRDGLVERLYAAAPAPYLAEPEGARSGGGSPFGKAFRSGSPTTPPSSEGQDKEVEIEEEEKMMLLSIKDSLEEPNQSDEEIFRLLQKLVSTDVTCEALQQTQIGRHVYKMRKHGSCEVRVLAKILVSKWRKTVDEWVKINPENSSPPANITDGDSPRQIAQGRSNHNGHRACDFSYSRNPHSVINYLNYSKVKEEKECLLDSEKLALARRRLQENYQKVKEEKECLLDSEKLALARRRLQENYQRGSRGRYR
ncbi:putative mediator of RNA polymerase II transcription subunit 26c [Iris pallida]|uniref:Mediator of RNA polymerase II transcription subunit 26c n=1 Tax=Iris pallida TaxID=29817 RepID=A0AAX6GSG3_IRIPA|nr:putative mediator of RNA polymerase II transcription subunit 26c [Iris pallida]KAJ6831504.1 putative mediator of RNA polymerase II transcription subunit 26c [Iris pallida]